MPAASTLSPPPEPAAAAPRYGTVAIALHWLLAALILGSFSVGLWMSELPFSPLRLKLLQLAQVGRHHDPHAVGPAPARGGCRTGRRALPARILAAMPGWQLAAHRGAHRLMYLLFFAVPLLGWAYSSALGFPIVLFGVLPLPDFMAVDKDFAEAVLKPLHQASAFTLATVVALHALAALWHQFVQRDGLLDRMWPSPRRQP